MDTASSSYGSTVVVTQSTDKNTDENEKRNCEKCCGKVQNFLTRNGKYPVSIFYIIGNEFCERYSFYGMKTILIIYLTRWLAFNPNTATALFHGFTMVCYFAPLLGAIIADGYLGKYKTILYVSMVYLLGNMIMSLTAVPPPEKIGPLIALVLIAFGTGGIKPCVAAFGGDQFTKEQEKQMIAFFSFFYFAINAGSMLSTLISPVLRADVQCFGRDCYSLAFGVPAMLMLLSLSVFYAGQKQYKKYPPTGNLLTKVFGCIIYAIKNNCKKSDKQAVRSNSHWLDAAFDKYEPEFVDEVKLLLRVLLMFLPLPLFWALFDQQGSRWTLQAEQMDGNLGFLGKLKADQMQALNPILIIILIPISESCLYPVIDWCRIPYRPLQRMVTGMVFAISAFIVAGFVQLHINDLNDIKIPLNGSRLIMINAAPCDLYINTSFYKGKLSQLDFTDYKFVPAGDLTIRYNASCFPEHTWTVNLNISDGKASRLFFYVESQKVLVNKFLDRSERVTDSSAAVSFFSSLLPRNASGLTVKLRGPKSFLFSHLSHARVTKFWFIKPGRYEVYYLENGSSWKETNQTVELDSRSIYTILLVPNNQSKQVSVKLISGLQMKSVSMLYQIPQYILITTGEIMFSITGLSFAYSQAPASMKSVVQAAWLMTVAFGNLIVVIVAEIHIIKNQALEFFMFAALLGVDVIIFSVMSVFYKYRAYMPESMLMTGVDDLSNLVDTEDTELPEDKTQ